MNNQSPNHSQNGGRDQLIVGIDWADSKHDLTVFDGKKTKHFRISADNNDVAELIAHLHDLAGPRPIVVCLEKARVRIIYHLMLHENITLYPVDPKQASRYRETFGSSGAKDDNRDSYYLARMLAERQDDLAPLRPDDPLTRRISLLCQTRRQLVDDKTAVIQQLHAVLKMYHPLLLALPGKRLDSGLKQEVLRRWPDPRKFKKLNRLTLEKLFKRHHCGNEEQIAALVEQVRSYLLATTDGSLIDPLVIRSRTLGDQLRSLEKGIASLEKEIAKAMKEHPDAKLYTSLPGAGAALAPRLLAAMGSDRQRFADASELGSYSGILPVTRQSGKTKHVSRRRACPKYVRQTFHEFADGARKFSVWSGAFYRLQRSRGMAHHAALRKLASRWQRILLSIWKSGVPYDESRYLESLRAKNHPLLPFLPQTETR
jgi:transposase